MGYKAKLTRDNRKPILVSTLTHQKIKDYAEMSNRTMQFMTQEMLEKGETQLRADDYISR